MSGQSQHGADLPPWLQDLPLPTEDEFRVWDERQAAREDALDILTGGLLAKDPERVALGTRMLDELPHAGTIGLGSGHAQDEDLLNAALHGRATTQELVEGLRLGMVPLTDDQQAFVGADVMRLRVLALSIRQDVSPLYLEDLLFPKGQPRLTMAARAGTDSSERLADWLDEHPEVTGATPDVRWHG